MNIIKQRTYIVNLIDKKYYAHIVIIYFISLIILCTNVKNIYLCEIVYNFLS